MNTPVFDFAVKYINDKTLRFHMPGHKGKKVIGAEEFDITEIKGADSLFEADGIIAESEKNATEIFGSRDTFYSAEGSSLCIRTMLALAVMHAKGKRPVIFVGRNAHKTFLSAAALLDFEVKWLYSENGGYLSCVISPEMLEHEILTASEKPTAVYITSPDYLGICSDVERLAKVCHKYGIMLLVDNAHGAYLKFLKKSRHPMDLGADICCDSAHKTLSVLTGGAYLHIGKNAPLYEKQTVKNTMSLFASTSPSYLILESLDLTNRFLSDGYEKRLEDFEKKMEEAKKCLQKNGYSLLGDEPLKITISTKGYGYYGTELAEILREKHNTECEFADPDFIVFMLVPGQENELDILVNALTSINKRTEIVETTPVCTQKKQILSVREAMFSISEEISVKDSEGRVLASASVGCPPAVPILVCGERIDKDAINTFLYYGIEKCYVVKLR